MDWRGADLPAVYPGQVGHWILLGQQQRHLGLWRGRFLDYSLVVGVLLGPNFVVWRRIYSGVCQRLWFQNSAGRQRDARQRGHPRSTGHPASALVTRPVSDKPRLANRKIT